jgi:hypothetical protein
MWRRKRIERRKESQREKKFGLGCRKLLAGLFIAAGATHITRRSRQDAEEGTASV